MMLGTRDITLKQDRPRELLYDKHEEYIKQYTQDETGTDQIMAEYLKMSGIYWGTNALYLMGKLESESAEVQNVLEGIKVCQNKDGGFAAAPRHDSHLLHTVCAVQTLVILKACDSRYIDVKKCVDYVKSLQQQDGSFAGDKWGEVDSRFSLCALATLRLLRQLDSIDIDAAVNFIMKCNNEIDGGFGGKPGSESHTAYVYCCVSSIAIANKLDLINTDQLSRWLSERQLPSGGLNGRPEKLPDVCYSWWCLASLKIINKTHMIDMRALLDFILACQDNEQGGFSDRPGNMVDPYHTMFALASISLICEHEYDQMIDLDFKQTLSTLRSRLKQVNPELCIPVDRLSDMDTLQ